MPLEMAEFSRSLAAVTLFSSNFVFWQESGYFNTAAELKPLLHTWSLAVEEQYYLLFPIVLILTWRLKRHHVVVLITVVAILSFGIAEWGSAHRPWAAFFLLPTRAWEILVGSLAAFYIFLKGTPRPGQILSGVGLVMIVGSVFALDDKTPFPGIYALPATLGTALIILFASPKTVVGRLLSLKLLVGVGLVSYGAYLWHQPLLAFAKIKMGEELSTPQSVLLIVILFPLAYLTYRYVETPVRRKKVLASNNFFVVIIGLAAAYLCLGLLGHQYQGFPTRLNSVYGESARSYEASFVDAFTIDTDANRATKDLDPRPTILMIGDSQVGSWSVAFNGLIDHSKYRVVSLSYLGCELEFTESSIGVSVAPWALGHEKFCNPFSKYINDREMISSVSKIILTSFRPFEHEVHLFRFELLEWLKSRAPTAEVFVVGNYFQMQEPQSCLSLMFRTDQPASVCIRDSAYPTTDHNIKKQPYFSRLKVDHVFLDPIALHCGARKENCEYEINGVPFMVDDNHLTRAFALHLLRISRERERQDHINVNTQITAI